MLDPEFLDKPVYFGKKYWVNRIVDINVNGRREKRLALRIGESADKEKTMVTHKIPEKI